MPSNDEIAQVYACLYDSSTQLATAMRALDDAMKAACVAIALDFPLGSKVSWETSRGESFGIVVGLPRATEYSPFIQVENAQTRKIRWVPLLDCEAVRGQ